MDTDLEGDGGEAPRRRAGDTGPSPGSSADSLALPSDQCLTPTEPIQLSGPFDLRVGEWVALHERIEWLEAQAAEAMLAESFLEDIEAGIGEVDQGQAAQLSEKLESHLKRVVEAPGYGSALLWLNRRGGGGGHRFTPTEARQFAAELADRLGCGLGTARMVAFSYAATLLGRNVGNGNGDVQPLELVGGPRASAPAATTEPTPTDQVLAMDRLEAEARFDRKAIRCRQASIARAIGIRSRSNLVEDLHATGMIVWYGRTGSREAFWVIAESEDLQCRIQTFEASRPTKGPKPKIRRNTEE